MSQRPTDSPLRWTRRTLRSGWNNLLTVYYANSPSWRLLKSGALLFLGFFCWAGGSILRSYLPGLSVLRYLQAYGFVLIGYGPFHHAVVIPLYQRLRRQGRHLSLGRVTLPNASLAVFLALVVLLGTSPVGPMTIDFTATLEDSGVDVDPALLCVKGDHGNGTEIHCHLSESRGVDSVVVRSGGRTLVTDGDPPFEFTVRAADLETTAGNRRLTVVLRDAEGSLVRRYTRELDRIAAE